MSIGTDFRDLVKQVLMENLSLELCCNSRDGTVQVILEFDGEEIADVSGYVVGFDDLKPQSRL